MFRYTIKLHDSQTDQSITSDKIDFATFATAPIISKTAAGPYEISINLQRTMNLVFYSIFSTANGIPQTGTSSETIPVGFRPIQNTTAVVRHDNGEAGRWTVQTDGKANWYAAATGNTNFTINLCYPTNDPWPNS